MSTAERTCKRGHTVPAGAGSCGQCRREKWAALPVEVRRAQNSIYKAKLAKPRPIQQPSNQVVAEELDRVLKRRAEKQREREELRAAGDASIFGRHLDPATTPVQPLETPLPKVLRRTVIFTPAKRTNGTAPTRTHHESSLGPGKPNIADRSPGESGVEPRSRTGVSDGEHRSRQSARRRNGGRSEKPANGIRGRDALCAPMVKRKPKERTTEPKQPDRPPRRVGHDPEKVRARWKQKNELRRLRDAPLIAVKPKPNGRTGVSKQVRNAIKAWLAAKRRENPELEAKQARAMVQNQFGVQITLANFYGTYWKVTRPGEWDPRAQSYQRVR